MKGLFEFFDSLAANNNRPWFQVNKERYTALRGEWIAGMNRVIAAVGAEWPEVAHQDASRCTYRIYRDVRFSPDKSPYKTYISSSVADPALRGCHSGIYVTAGVKSADTGIYAGVWAPEAPLLRKLRRAIDDNAEEFLDIVNAPALVKLYGKGWAGDALKTAPKGYDKEHPMIEYLRLKDIGKFCPMTRRDFESRDWPEIVAERILPALPLVRFIDYSILEEV